MFNHTCKIYGIMQTFWLKFGRQILILSVLILGLLPLGSSKPVSADPPEDPNIELDYIPPAPLRRPALVVNAEDLTDVNIRPGGVISLTVAIENRGARPVENVGINLDAMPAFSTARYPVGDIEAGRTFTATIPMTAQRIPPRGVHIWVNVIAERLINPIQTTALVTFMASEPTEQVAGIENPETIEYPVAWEPTFYDPVVSLFSGSATYNFPFLMPPGPGELSPGLGLVYNGSIAHGAAGKQQANVAGYGWHLSGLVEVTQPLELCYDDEFDFRWEVCAQTNIRDERFVLSFGGASYQLIRENLGSNQEDTYRVEGHAGLYVEYCDGTSVSQACRVVDVDDGNPQDPEYQNGKPDDTGQRSAGFWLVKGPDGNAYRLGYWATSEQEIFNNREGNNIGNYLAMTWRLDKTLDRYGNAINYTYFEDSNSLNAPPHVPASYLTQVDYGFNRIILNYEEITQLDLQGQGDETDAITWHTHRLEEIIIQAKDYELPDLYKTLRSYELEYLAQRFGNASDAHQTEDCEDVEYNDPSYEDWLLGLLVDITEIGSDGQPRAYDEGERSIPTVKFKYDWRQTSVVDAEPNDIVFCYPYLHEVRLPLLPSDNDHPNISFDYINGAFSAYSQPPAGLTGAWANIVTTKSTDGGWDSDPFTINYAYSNPNYQGKETRLQGFTDVVQTDSLNTREVENNFLAYAYDSDDSVLTGRLNTQLTLDGETGTIKYQLVDNNWDVNEIQLTDNTLHQPELVRSDIVLFDLDDDLKMLVTHTDYDYDDYGNQTFVFEYGAGDSPYRTTEMRYVYNTTPEGWLVNLPWVTRLRQGGAGGTILAQERYRYDDWICDAVGDNSVPTEGLLTAVDSWIPNGGGDCEGTWISTTYDYGTIIGAEDWQLTEIHHPEGREEELYWQNDTLLIENRTIADGIQYSTNYYYFDNTFPWQPNRIEKSNGAEYKYTYDHFGRLTHIYTPDPATGDAMTEATTQILYADGAAPFYIESISVPDEASLTKHTRRFYDGLGQVQQERTWDIGLSGYTTALIATQYDGWGRTTCQTTALKTNQTFFNAGLDCDSATYNYNRVNTEYDALDRTTLVTSYDGDEVNGHVTNFHHFITTHLTTGTQMHHYVRKIEDANHHVTAQVYNTFGELMRVREYTGEFPNDIAYADTEYRYDVAGNLTLVQSRKPNDAGTGDLLSESTMGYDELGRKTSMTDADMGSWIYEYDFSGNMVAQTDAEGQKVCFYYDELDRPLRKIEDSTPANDCPSLAGAPSSGPYHLNSTTYLTSGFGKGQVGTVSWGPDPTDNYEQFTYDARSRLIEHTREIEESAYSMEIASFDALDRPLTVIYPDGETVTTGYDRQGINTLSAGSDNLVTNATFNERGQMTLLERGNDLDTNYSYYFGEENFALSNIQHGVALDPLPDFSYTYDPVGNAETIEEELTSGIGSQTQSFEYDELNRLTNAEAPFVDPMPAYDHTYSYSKIGNIANYAGNKYRYSGDYQDQPHAVRDIYSEGTGYKPIEFTVWSENVVGGQQTTVELWAKGKLFQTFTLGLDGQNETFYYNVYLSDDYSLALVVDDTHGYDLELINLKVNGLTIAKTDMIWDGGDPWDGDDLQVGDAPAYFLEGGYHYVHGAGQHFGYDNNGNMTLRMETGAAYRQTFDVQNRLVAVDELFNGSTTTFAYDANGQRTLTIQPDGRTTHFPFPNYEVDGPESEMEVTRSLYAAGQPVALREQGDMDEDFEDINADGWQAYTGTWSIGNDFCKTCTYYYRQSDNTANNASAVRPVSQIYSTTPYVYEWTAEYVSGSRLAGLYFFASEADTVHHGNAYFVDQKGDDIRIFEVTNNNLALRRQSGAATSNGESHDYKVTYDPNAGWIFVYRDGNYITGWQDPTPLTSGNYVALRTHDSDIKFDDVKVNWTWFSYFHTDHLGSVRAMSDEDGNLVNGSTVRFLPFGDWRTEPASELTDKGFTGHKHNNYIKLVYMNARWYAGGIGRFISPDTIVPDHDDPQSLNRYSYSFNNPLKYTDPTGHDPIWCNDPYDGGGGAECAPLVNFSVSSSAGSNISWSFKEKLEVIFGASMVDFALLEFGAGFLEIFGGTVTFEKTGITASNLGETISINLIVVNEQSGGISITSDITGEMWAAHELGHAFNYALYPNSTDNSYYGQGLIDLAIEGLTTVDGEKFSGLPVGSTAYSNYDLYVYSELGYQSTSGPYVVNNDPWPNEDFANMFANWVFNSFSGDVYGEARYDFMQNHMANWIALAVNNQ